MKKLSLYLLLLCLTGCASFERRLADDIVHSDAVKLNRCEIEGFVYPGVDAELKQPEVLKILMIHGVGTHHPGYSDKLQQNLANNIGMNVISRQSKNIKLLDPSDHQTPIGNLRITFWQNEEASKNMLFYELTWSEITTPDKQIIAFDTTEQYSEFRVPFNNMMKEFLDNVLPDPLVYVTDPHNLILNSSKQSICWMLTTDWNNIPNGQAKVCNIGIAKQAKQLASQNTMFITHSLGSKILMDSITDIAEQIADSPVPPADRQALRQKKITVFMLANQLPILQISHPQPKIHNQINAYCTPQGSKYQNRIFRGLNIVAFSDPNDILSYAIPQEFTDKYIDSRICPFVTNVSVNVAPEISAFGVGIVNPVSAHIDYDSSPKVINLITRGTENFSQDQSLREQCHFIRMKNDNQMRPFRP